METKTKKIFNEIERTIFETAAKKALQACLDEQPALKVTRRCKKVLLKELPETARTLFNATGKRISPEIYTQNVIELFNEGKEIRVMPYFLSLFEETEIKTDKG